PLQPWICGCLRCLYQQRVGEAVHMSDDLEVDIWKDVLVDRRITDQPRHRQCTWPGQRQAMFTIWGCEHGEWALTTARETHLSHNRRRPDSPVRPADKVRVDVDPPAGLVLCPPGNRVRLRAYR